ncbi:hypothetical protein AMECASPLE_023228 [Ameca splendens]|uniref:Uncharacterized protein n=1 Tax=Ameca splendens TaxID=208324 RepID=A0ABV0XSZ8_9TELE
MDSGFSLFYPLAAGSDVCFIAPGEPCPPSSEPLRTTLLQRCSVAHSPSRIITSLPQPDSLSVLGFQYLVLQIKLLKRFSV